VYGGVFPSCVPLAVKADEHRLQYIALSPACQAISCIYNTLRSAASPVNFVH
jgi:hypothetical protein